MKLEEWIKAVNANNVLVIFGYAVMGENLYKNIRMKLPNQKIVFCDNSSYKHGINPNGEVMAVAKATSLPHAQFAIASLWHSKQMREQLVSLGIKEDNIFTELPEEIIEAECRREEQVRLTPRTGFRVEVNITKHCNLNCKGCDHFSPVSPVDNMPVELFERDMQEMARIFGDEQGEFRLLGGEPLLHPQIVDFIQITRKALPQAKIFISTNGTLLKKMTEEFYENCRKLNIAIETTKYPISLDYDELGEWLRSKGVAHSYIGSSEGGRTLWHFPLDFTGSKNPRESYLGCRNANTCWTLEEGRLFTCSIAPNLKVFEQHFQKGIHLTPQDGVDIYTANNAEEVAKALALPMPCCRYCDVKKRTYDHEWGISKKDIKEWSL